MLHTLKSGLKGLRKRIPSRVRLRLAGAPHRKGTVTRLAIMTPKKPNSAIRNVAKIISVKGGRRNIARVPGIGNLPTKFNRVLARGGRANDLPTVRLTLVRGVFDFSPLFLKKRKRSKYGAPRPESKVLHIRRKFRHLHG